MNAQPMSLGFGFWLNLLLAYMGGNLLTVQSFIHTHSNDDTFHDSDKTCWDGPDKMPTKNWDRQNANHKQSWHFVLQPLLVTSTQICKKMHCFPGEFTADIVLHDCWSRQISTLNTIFTNFKSTTFHLYSRAKDGLESWKLGVVRLVALPAGCLSRQVASLFSSNVSSQPQWWNEVHLDHLQLIGLKIISHHFHQTYHHHIKFIMTTIMMMVVVIIFSTLIIFFMISLTIHLIIWLMILVWL